MKQRLAMIVGAALIAGLYVPVALAQLTGSVSGVCKDDSGNPDRRSDR